MIKIKKLILTLVFILTAVLFFSSGAAALQLKRVTAAEILEIKLYENPSTGHRWEVEIENEALLSKSEDDYKRLESKEGLVGRGGIHSWSFKAEKKGFTLITFKLRAPGDQKVVETKDYLIAVDLAVKEIATDEIIEIKLAENPSTGYRWQLQAEESKFLQLLKKEYQPLNDALHPEDSEDEELAEASNLLAGQGGIKSWTFRGLEEGYQLLTFELARSGGQSIKSKEIIVLVE